MKYLLYFGRGLVVVLLCNFSACNEPAVPKPVIEKLPEFETGKVMGEITNSEIDEASGMVSSINMPGMFWLHNDSGDRNRVFLINSAAKWMGTFTLNGVQNRDWEDIAISKFPDNENYLFVGDIGDNDANYNNEYFIYKFKEPKTLPANTADVAINNVETIKFNYPDTSHDAEALMIDHATKDLYIVTKREERIKVYILAYPQSTTNINKALLVADLPIGGTLGGVPTGATAGDISIDNQEIIIKSYFQIFYWKLKKDETIKQAFSRSYDKLLPYNPVPQEEAIAFSHDNSGFYTIAEGTETRNIVNLYFYKRKL
jgi:hypothetical protein